MPAPRRACFEITHDWCGEAARANEHAFVDCALDDAALEVSIDAAYHRDPPPPSAPGRTERLWEHEVVELFLLGERERYLEIELGPHGHWLALRLEGVRHVVERNVALEYTARVEGTRWRGRARLSRALVPEPIVAANAYAIHGAGRVRRYLASHPVPGLAPDFHRLECFQPMVWEATDRGRV